MPITSTPANLSNLAKGSLAAKISAAQTSGITVTADAYTTASGTKYGQFPTGNSILKLTSTTQSNVTKVEFMGVESASQTDSAVTLGTCIRDLDWEDGSDFTSQSDGLAFPAGTTVELVWTVQHAENTPFKNNANTFTGKQTFSGGRGVLVYATLAELEAVLGDYIDGDDGFYVTETGSSYSKKGGAWVADGDTGTENASETVAGKVELATVTQENAGTDTGDTGAPTFVRPSNVTTVDNLASTEEGKGSALVGHEGGTTVKAKLDGIDTSLTTISQTTLTAGETITGATLPVPVYQKAADGELYACDANDTDAMNFIGFAVSNSTDGNPIQFQGAGVVGGFTGLTVGAWYFVQDAAGTIGATKGTYTIPVGKALTATQILIAKSNIAIAGTTVLASSTAEVSINNASYQKAKEIRVNNIIGIVTVSFNMRSGSGSSVFGRIYINGVAVGTERTQTSSSNIQYDENLLVNPGDIVALYLKNQALTTLLQISSGNSPFANVIT
jgi:hypothetical protein